MSTLNTVALVLSILSLIVAIINAIYQGKH